MHHCNCATVASTDHDPSNSLVKLKSRFDTQTSIIDGDFPDKRLINDTSTPGKLQLATTYVKLFATIV